MPTTENGANTGKNNSGVFIIVALILGFSMIICCILGMYGLASYKQKKYEVKINGYSKKQITSDLVDWTGYYDLTCENMQNGYAQMESNKNTILAYLKDRGVSENEITFSSVSFVENRSYYTDEDGNAVNEVKGYTMGQSVSISSSNIDLITDISRSSSELINKGIHFQSRQPEYRYTKLEDLKIDMLAEASADAKSRAKIVAENAGSKLGALTSAKLSSIKISPLYSVPSEFDNWGYSYYVSNDVASIEKEVTVTVYCTYIVK